jgi:glycosyltransferase involved in cell wall biosynthesis
MIGTVVQVYREAVRVHADVYHFHDPELIPVGLMLTARGKKVVYDVHEDLPLDVRVKDYIPRWMRAPLAWLVGELELAAVRRFAAVTPATPSIGARVSRANANTVEIFNWPIAEELGPRDVVRWSRRSCSVAYVGFGITRNRGAREMIEAVGLVSDAVPVRLLLAGKFRPEGLRREMTQLEAWAQVEEMGFIDRRSVAAVLAEVRAGLVLLHPEPQFQVAYPVKMFEYMAAGVPVIASRFPLWESIVSGTGCGLVVDPLDVRAIAAAIEYVLTHAEEAEAMGRRGREAVRTRYNWALEEAKLLDLYSRLEQRVCAG